MEVNKIDKLVNIRVNTVLWKEAKKAAIDQNQLLKDWVTEAIKAKLEVSKNAR